MKNYYCIFPTILIFLLLSCSHLKEAPPELIAAVKNYHGSADQNNQLLKWCELGHDTACLFTSKSINLVKNKQLPIMQSTTLDHETVLSVLVPRKIDPKTLHISIYDRASLKALSPEIKTVKFQWSPREDYLLLQLVLNNLDEKREYEIIVVSEDQTIQDKRHFTISAGSAKNQANFVITSCMDDYHPQQAEMWDQLYQDNPDFVLMIGDNVYADAHIGLVKKPSKDDLLERYLMTREKLNIFYWPKLKPIYAIWDDHDYGQNNGNQFNPNKVIATEIFTSFFPNKLSKKIIPGPGLSYSVSLNGHQFYFLDNRSFRGEEKNPKDDHFGEQQEKWLFNYLNKVSKPTFIISGDQFFGEHPRFESFKVLHPVKFKSFYQEILSKKFPITFISGDRHFAELLKDQSKPSKPIYELTSSGIHAKVYKGTMTDFPNPLQVQGVDGRLNYMLVKSSYDGTQKVELKAKSDKNEVLFENLLYIK